MGSARCSLIWTVPVLLQASQRLTCVAKNFSMSSTDSASKEKEDLQLPAYFDLDGSATLKDPVDLKVEGEIPKWIKGSLYRNGGGVYKMGNMQFKHLFDGFSVLTRWTIQDGRVSFLSTALDTDTYKESVKANRLVGIHFGSYFPDPCKSIFGRFFSYFRPGPSGSMDNTAVNIVELGDKLYALTETAEIHEVNPKTLLSDGKVDLKKYVAIHTGTAHPHADKDGSWIYYATNFNPTKAFNFVKVSPQATEGKPFSKAEIIGTAPSRWKLNIGYTHSFGITENYIIHFELPLAYSVLGMSTLNYSKKCIEDNLANYPNEPIKIHVISRQSGKRIPINYLAPHGFVFHFINCYEENGFIICDVCLWDSGETIHNLYLDEIMKRQKEKSSYLSYFGRFVLPLSLDGAQPGQNLVTSKDTQATAVLSEKEKDTLKLTRDTSFDDSIFFELPRINYDYNGQKYRYAYGTTLFHAGQRKLVKMDTETKTAVEWQCPKTHIVGEPVFVKSPDGKEEDDGVILSPILAESLDHSSFLLILDASSFKEIARATLPADIKCNFSFHGDFYNKVF